MAGFKPTRAKPPSHHRTNPHPLRSAERIAMDPRGGGATPPLPGVCGIRAGFGPEGKHAEGMSLLEGFGD